MHACRSTLEDPTTRTREREPVKENNYERVLRFYREFQQRQHNGPVVIKPSDRELEVSRQGRLLYYLFPFSYKEPPLQDWIVFLQDIRTHSGMHRHQGGLVIYVIEGRGYSVVEGERIDWSGGDLLLLPMKPGGVAHQHFNSDPNVKCRWIAFVYGPIADYLGLEITQMQTSPEFKG